MNILKFNSKNKNLTKFICHFDIIKTDIDYIELCVIEQYRNIKAPYLFLLLSNNLIIISGTTG